MPGHHYINQADSGLGNPVPTIQGEREVIAEIRQDILQVFADLGMHSGSVIPETWYFSLLSIDPDFAQQHFIPTTWYTGFLEPVRMSGLQFLLSRGLSDEEVTNFARCVIKKEREGELASWGHEYVLKNLAIVLSNSERGVTLSQLFAEGLLREADVVKDAIFDTQKKYPAFEKEGYRTLQQVLSGNSLDDVIESSWERALTCSKWQQAVRDQSMVGTFRREIICVIAFGQCGMPSDKLSKQILSHLEYLEQITPVEVSIEGAEEFLRLTGLEPIGVVSRISKNEFKPLSDKLREGGFLLTAELEQMFRDLLVSVFVKSNNNIATPSGLSFADIYRNAVRELLCELVRVDRGSITFEKIGELFHAAGLGDRPEDIRNTSECCMFLELINEKAAGILDQRVSAEVYPDIAGGQTIDDDDLSEWFRKNTPGKILTYYIPNTLFSFSQIEKEVENFTKACEEGARQSSPSFGECYPPHFFAVLNSLAIPLAKKRELTRVFVAHNCRADFNLGIDIAEKEDYLVFRRLLNYYYSPLSEYRGGIGAFHERHDGEKNLPPAFTSVMSNRYLFTSVKSEDLQPMIDRLAELFLYTVEGAYQPEGEFDDKRLSQEGADSQLVSKRRLEKVIAPLQSFREQGEAIGRVSRELRGADRYLMTTICNSYSRSTMQYLPIGTSILSASADFEISKLMQQRDPAGNTHLLGVTLFNASDRSILPIPLRGLPRGIELPNTAARVEIEFDSDNIPFIRSGLGDAESEISFLVACHSENIDLTDLTIDEYARGLPRDIRKSLSKKGVSKRDLPEQITSWIDSIKPDSKLIDRVDQLISMVGSLYRYDLHVGENPFYRKLIETIYKKTPRKDPYLAAIHSCAESPYIGATVCGGASHIVVQALRHAGIPVAMGGGFLLPHSSRVFTDLNRHAFPLLLFKQGERVLIHPLEATAYMRNCGEAGTNHRSIAPLLSPQIDFEAISQTPQVLPSTRSQVFYRWAVNEQLGVDLNEVNIRDLDKRLKRVLAARGRARNGNQESDAYAEFLHTVSHLCSSEGSSVLSQVASHRSLSEPQIIAVDQLRMYVKNVEREVLDRLQ